MEAAGLSVVARRLRTPLGEIDLLAADSEWLIAVEVKRRRSLGEGAVALGARQSGRLLAALDYVLATRPEWRRPNTRIDLIMVDSKGNARRIMDAVRLG